MSTSGGPKKITDGLVLSFDASNIISFRGEPTTNILPNPSNNGRFTSSNSWGTYNTNQYCGNNGCAQFWDIPSISSVSNNIITTSSPHQIRSFDVIKPQTTGGGVTAGVNYLAKKISPTQFSLHVYNGSQNGTQGYINPQTGGHKVHDSFWLDERVLVNSSNFPTKWFGDPHLPNSGLVKELVIGGGYEKNTNSMRLHLSRADGVADGMAYGVDTSVNQGDIVTVSFYYRTTVSNGAGKSVNWQTWFGGNSAPNVSFTIGSIYEWRRFTHTWTASVTFSFIQYWFPQGSGDIYSFDIADIQVEKKPYATFFTTGTRGTTVATGGGWLDRSGNNNHGELVNGVSFNSDNFGSLQFDGVDDRVELSNTIGTISQYTISYWSKRDAENRMPISTINNDFYWYGDNSWRYVHGGVGGEYYYPRITSIPLGTWGYYTVVYNGSNVTIYRQGVYQGQQSTSGNANFSSPLRIGWWSSNFYAYLGNISSVSFYNRALTSSEVLQNFNATKSRYGL